MILRAVVVSLLFTGVSHATAAPLPLNAAAGTAATPASTRTAPIEVLDDRLVLVRVLVNGTGPHLFLLDTGGASTVVSDTLARQLGLVPSGSHRIDTMSGSRTVGRARVDELRVGTETFTAVDVLWMDLAHVRTCDARIQGIIGQSLLRTRSFMLDYDARRLTFNPDPPEPADGVRLPLDWSQGRPMIRAVAHHAGRGAAGPTRAALRFVIDSGGTHVILFDRASSLVEALRPNAAATMTMTSHAGSRPVMTATVDRLELSEETALRDVVTALVPADPEQGRIEDGLLPASLFRAIYFDNRAGEVVLRRR
jgi:hypothetical protein